MLLQEGRISSHRETLKPEHLGALDLDTLGLVTLEVDTVGVDTLIIDALR